MTQPSDPVRRRAKELFEEVVDLPPAQRAEALDRLAAGDEAARTEVASLLRAHDEAEGFISDPTIAPSAGGRRRDAAERSEGVGSQVGPYRLVEVIGEGGFGTVFLAEQEQPVRRRVALKLIKLGMDTNQVVARFEAERQALALMGHPNIARVFDAGATESGRPYFVMELVEGVPITRYCDEQRLTPQERLELFVPVCQAVQHAHQKGIIHRDLKPTNVLVAVQDDRPVPKVIDFGIAKATDARLTERTLFTEQRQLIGTPEYMSPEQAAMGGAAADVDTRSDVYSLGVLLYELLTGTTPFDGRELRSKAFAEMQRTIREVDPPRPSTRLSEMGAGHGSLADVAARRRMAPSRLSTVVHGELDWIVMKCLEKERPRRYQTAAELATDIGRYLAHEPVTAAAPSRAYVVRKFVRRHRIGLSAAAAVTMALLAGLGSTGWFAVEARREAQRATREAQRATDAERLAQERLAEVEAQRREADERRAEAEAANADSKAVNEFLTKDLLGAADPAVNLGEDLTVKEALDRAAQTVEEKFGDRPRIEATVRNAVALTYTALGRADLGLPHAQAAVELRREALGDEHPDTLFAINDLGFLLHAQGRSSEAEPMFREALEKQQRVLGEDHPDTVQSMNNLAMAYLNQGRLAEAEPLLRQTMEKLRLVRGEDDRQTLICANNLASALNAGGKTAEAETLLRDTLERLRHVQGEDHPDTLLTLTNLAYILVSEDRLAEAEPLAREAAERHKRVLGEDHPGTLHSMNNLGSLLRRQGKPAEAEALFRRVLETQRRVLGEDHPDTLITLGNFGRLFREQGRLSEAEAIYRERLEKCRRLLGDEHPHTLGTLNSLGLTLLEQGHFDEAEPLYREALETQRRVLGPEHPDTQSTLHNLSSLLADQKKWAEAEAMLRDVLEMRQRLLGEEHRSTLASLHELGVILNAQGRVAEAESVYRKVLEGERRVLRPGDTDITGTLNNLGVLLIDQNRLTEAEPLMREAMDTRRRALGEDHPDTLVAIHNFGGLLHAQGRLDEAEPLYRKALEKRRQVLGNGQPRTLLSANRLGMLLLEKGDADEAEPLLLEAYNGAQKLGNSDTSARYGGDYGVLLVKLGRPEEGLPLLLTAVQSLEREPWRSFEARRRVFAALVNTYERLGDSGEAGQWRERLDGLPRSGTTRPNPL